MCVHFDTENFRKACPTRGQNGFTGTLIPKNSTSQTERTLILNVAFTTGFLVFFLLGLLGDAEPRPAWHVVTEYLGILVGSGFALYLVISQLGWDRDTDMSKVWVELRR